MNNTQSENLLTKEVYILSGLGADERVFQKLDFSGVSVTFIKWILPNERETIENYTKRLLGQIKSKKPTLIGLSFGGIIAVEMAKQIETEKVILIASAKTKNEIPFYFRFAGKIRLLKLLPSTLLKSSNFMSNWFFGTTSTFDKQILKQTLIDTDPKYLKWAIDKVLNWQNETLPVNIFHIHGTNDRVLPIKFVNCDCEIKDGGHFMILNKAEQLSFVLRQQLKL